MMMNDGLAVDCKPNEMENSVAKQQKEKKTTSYWKWAYRQSEGAKYVLPAYSLIQ